MNTAVKAAEQRIEKKAIQKMTSGFKHIDVTFRCPTNGSLTVIVLPDDEIEPVARQVCGDHIQVWFGDNAVAAEETFADNGCEDGAVLDVKKLLLDNVIHDVLNGPLSALQQPSLSESVPSEYRSHLLPFVHELFAFMSDEFEITMIEDLKSHNIADMTIRIEKKLDEVEERCERWQVTPFAYPHALLRIFRSKKPADSMHIRDFFQTILKRSPLWSREYGTEFTELLQSSIGVETIGDFKESFTTNEDIVEWVKIQIYEIEINKILWERYSWVIINKLLNL